jgi:hypothetical protein
MRVYQVSGSHEQCSEVRLDKRGKVFLRSASCIHAAESSTSRAIISMAKAIFVRQARSLLAMVLLILQQHSTWDNSTYPRLSLSYYYIDYCRQTARTYLQNYTALQFCEARHTVHTHAAEGPESSDARV